ncbi:MAG: sortase [Candidatus Roizmanbacteria bacterium]
MNLNDLKKNLSDTHFLKILFLRTIGNFLVLLSLFLIVKTFSDPVIEEVKYVYDRATGKHYALAGDITFDYGSDRKKGLLADINKQKIELIKPVDSNFGIVIPKINANATIVPDVSVTNKDAYLAALKKGVAHASGTAFPGEGGHIFLFAHSTDNFWNVGRYNAIFYLLYKLGSNDEIDLFYKGARYKYIVDTTKIVDPTEVQYLTRKTKKETVTLQTCWPPGTTLKRLLIFAKPATN